MTAETSAKRSKAPRALLVSVHSTARGGAERCALYEVERLAKRFRLVIAAPPGPLQGEFARHGIVAAGPPLLPIWGAPGWRWALQMTRTVLDSFRLARLVRRYSIAGIVSNSSSALSPILAGQLTRRPTVLHLRDSPNSKLGRPLFRLEAALATTVIAISEQLRDLCESRFSRRVVVMPDGIPIPPARPRPPFRDPIRIGVIAAIDEGKGQDIAVLAIKELGLAHAQVELCLVGREQDPKFTAALRDLIDGEGLAERVKLTGEQSDVEALYRDLDILLLPSRRDWTPLVVMEALARGIPVVGTTVGAVPDLLLHGDAGLLVESDAPGATATALLSLCREPRLARELAERGRSHMAKNYNVDNSLATAEDEIERVLDAATTDRTRRSAQTAPSTLSPESSPLRRHGS